MQNFATTNQKKKKLGVISSWIYRQHTTQWYSGWTTGSDTTVNTGASNISICQQSANIQSDLRTVVVWQQCHTDHCIIPLSLYDSGFSSSHIVMWSSKTSGVIATVWQMLPQVTWQWHQPSPSLTVPVWFGTNVTVTQKYQSAVSHCLSGSLSELDIYSPTSSNLFHLSGQTSGRGQQWHHQCL